MSETIKEQNQEVYDFRDTGDLNFWLKTNPSCRVINFQQLVSTIGKDQYTKYIF